MKKRDSGQIFGVVFLSFLMLALLSAPLRVAWAGTVQAITSIFPDHGTRGANTRLTIKGTGFSPGTKVSIWGGGIYVKGSSPTRGPANGLYCSGGYAYLACGGQEDGGEGGSEGSGVQIFQIQSAASPSTRLLCQPVSFFPLPRQANDIFVFENYAYVAAGSGLHILDIHDPAHPALVSSLPLPGSALKISIYGQHIYIASDSGGLQIVNISDLKRPILAGSCRATADGYSLDVIAEGSRAYLAGGWAGVNIIDISRPHEPKVSATFPRPGRFVTGVYKHQDYLYLSEMQDGVEILDISDPLFPVVVSQVATPGLARQVAMKGNYLYVADDYRGIEIFRPDLIEGCSMCSMVGFQETPGWAVDLQVFENKIFVADSHGGFQILDAENPRNPSIVSITDLLDGSTKGGVQVSGLKVQGDYAYVLSRSDASFGKNWLKILDITNPKKPFVCGETQDIGSNPEDLAIGRSGYAYLMDGDMGLEVLNVTYKQSPQRVSFYDSDTSGGGGIFMRDNTLLAADFSASGQAGLKILSQDTKMLPSLLGVRRLDALRARPEAVCAVGDYACLAAGEAGLAVFDLRTLSQPSLISTLACGGSVKDVLACGPYAYLANQNGLVQSVLINPQLQGTPGTPSPSTPSTPTIPAIPALAGYCKTLGEPLALSLAGNYLYAAQGEAGFQVIDINQPPKPLAVASFPTLTPAEDIMAEGDYLYAAIRNGLMVVSAFKPCPLVSYVDSTTLKASTPAGLSPGTYHLTLTDPNGAMTLFPNGFTIEANRPPIVEPLAENPLIAVTEGETFTLTIKAIDPDGDTLTYAASLSRLPDGAGLSGNVFSWKPRHGESGLYPDIRFQVSDGDFIIEQEINFAVIDTGMNSGENTPPSLSPIGEKTTSEGKAIVFLIEAFDPDPQDRDNLKITMQNAPIGAICRTLPTLANKAAAYFLWTPAYGQAGTYAIAFNASDQQASAQKIISLKVQEPTPAPARLQLKAGQNVWLCPSGRHHYTSFAFLQELGADALYSLQAYDWDGTLLKSCFWLFGKPCGDDFLMDQSRIYRIQAKRNASFIWSKD